VLCSFAHSLTQRNTDYNFVPVINPPPGSSFNANILCWIVDGQQALRGQFEAGIFMGTPNTDAGGVNPCQISGTTTEVQMKTLLAVNGAWFAGQSGFLTSNPQHVPANRISVWVR
jgi:hypothetical protein